MSACKDECTMPETTEDNSQSMAEDAVRDAE